MKFVFCPQCQQHCIPSTLSTNNSEKSDVDCPHCQNTSNPQGRKSLSAMLLLGLMGCGDGDKPDTGVMPLYGAEEIRDTADTGEDTGADTGEDSAISVLYGVEQSDE